MIDEKKLIEEINRKIKNGKRLIVEPPCDKLDEIQNDIANGYLSCCSEICKYINNQPKVGEWIPCKVTMPKPQKNGSEDYTDSVWICTDTNIVAGAWYCFSEEKWYTNGAFIIGNVIAWMPLPEVYEERS